MLRGGPALTIEQGINPQALLNSLHTAPKRFVSPEGYASCRKSECPTKAGLSQFQINNDGSLSKVSTASASVVNTGLECTKLPILFNVSCNEPVAMSVAGINVAGILSALIILHKRFAKSEI